LRYNKIQQALNAIEQLDYKNIVTETDKRMQHLKAMTIGQWDDNEDAIVKIFKDWEGLTSQFYHSNPHDMAKVMNELLEKVQEQSDNVFEKTYAAELDLKELEEKILKEWKERKANSEYWLKRQSALKGMRHVLVITLGRCGALGLQSEEDYCNLSEASGMGVGRGSDSTTMHSDKSIQEPELHLLSDVVTDPNIDPQQREFVLRRDHLGSAYHPERCRPCHFQGGLCWKGFSCTFCHICPKPKRKSKHQRDVDKRRQERYKQVEKDLGAGCLNQLTKIDEGRRQLMASTEGLKKRVKDVYSQKEETNISQVNDVVFNLQNIIEQFHNSIPFPLDIVRVEENLENEVVVDDSQDEQEELSKADGHLGNFECREGDMVQDVDNRNFPQSDTSQRRMGRWYNVQNSRADVSAHWQHKPTAYFPGVGVPQSGWSTQMSSWLASDMDQGYFSSPIWYRQGFIH